MAVAADKPLKNSRSGFKGWLTKGNSALETLVKEVPIPRDKVKAQLDAFTVRLQKYRDVQSQIEALIDDETELSTEIDGQVDFDTWCSNVIAKFQPFTNSKATSGSSTGSASTFGYKAPKVDIPKFSGEIIQWLPFYQSFVNAVDKVDIPKYLKFTMLRNHLEGDALKVVEFYALTDENYSPALQSLVDKYGNEQKLIDAYVENLLDLRSKAGNMSLRQIYDSLLSSVSILESLNVSRDHYATILVPMLRGIFSKDVKLEWAKYELMQRDAHMAASAGSSGSASASGNALPSGVSVTTSSSKNRLTMFLDFLKREVEIRDLAAATQGSSGSSQDNQKKEDKHKKKDKDEKKKNGNPQGNPTASFLTTGFQGQPGKGSNPRPGPGKYDQQPQYQYYHRQGPSQGQGKILAPPCPFCSFHHHPDRCSRAADFSAAEVSALIRRDNRCDRCLGYHPGQDCRLIRPCLFCSAPNHHSLLCSSRQTGQQQKEKSSSIRQPGPAAKGLVPPGPDASVAGAGGTNNIVTALTNAVDSTGLLLQTAVVHAVGASGSSIVQRCFLDPCSHRTYITKDSASRLKLTPIRHESISVSGFGGQSKSTYSPVIELCLNSRHGFGSVQVQALVVDIISNSRFNVLTSAKELPSYSHLNDIPLADPPEFSHLPIDILIGVDHYWDIMGTDIRRGSSGKIPAAISSVFGYVVSGTDMVRQNQLQETNSFLTVLASSVKVRPSTFKLQDTVAKFFELEGIGITGEEQSNDELAQKLFDESVRFTGTRYEVGLPWRPNHPQLQSNKFQAEQRLIRLMKKLGKDPRLYESYSASLQEFIDSDFVEIAPLLTTSEAHAEFYLPHHPVVKASSSTYKTRPVCDASAKDFRGVSLNDCLLPGPSLIPEIVNVMLRFRPWKIAFIGDLKRAFLQIQILPNDRDALRILWGDTILRFKRVPFGVTSSPFLLNSTIRHHLSLQPAETAEERNLLEELDSNFYVDDLPTGDVDASSAIVKIEAASTIMSKAGMQLRNWYTNSFQVREALVERDIDVEKGTVTKVLGTEWNTETDTLSIRSVVWNESSITKRTILSFVSLVFDVLGLVSPIVVRGKILIQKLWIADLAWDDEIVNQSFLTEFDIVREEFQKLHQLKMPRWIGLNSQDSFSLHLMCDASPAAFAAAVYVVIGRCSQLLISKTRVAPIRAPKLSLARLELLACLIGARLLARVLKEMPISKNAVAHCWSDSQIALAWINSDQDVTGRREVFISNRVSEIQSRVPEMTWKYIPSKDNPADRATRPTETVETLENSIWFSGPEWITKSADQWPDSSSDNVVFATTTSVSSPPEDPTSTSSESDDDDQTTTQSDIGAKTIPTDPTFDPLPKSGPVDPLFDLDRRSRMMPALRITAYVLRFARHPKRAKLPVGERMLKLENGKQVSVPSHEELERARYYWTKYTQNAYFPEVMSAVRLGETISPKSRILDLGPAPDSDGLLRSVGRISRAPTAISPIILPSYAPFTRLVVLDYHEKAFHDEVTGTLNQTRTRYWIIRGRQTVKRILQRCLICKKHKVLPYLQMPSALPEWRVREQAPFASVGMDFAGPFSIREGKAYILLFTCSVTRALHLEVTPDRSAPSVVNAVIRTSSRRGAIHYVRSDNAKEFLHAKDSFPDMKWTTIPERAPWWGGFWERFVRSMKRALRRTLGRAGLTFEELRTVVPEIEAIINRRPVTYLSENRDDPAPLRPVDFLLTPGPPPMADASPSRQLVGRFKHRLAVIRTTWKRWASEYLWEVNRWTMKVHGRQLPKVGDVVLLQSTNVHITNRALFPMGRITRLIEGRDGHCRAAYVRVGDKELRRATRHLYPLETAPPELDVGSTDTDTVSNSERDQTSSVADVSTANSDNTSASDVTSDDVTVDSVKSKNTMTARPLTRTRSGRLVYPVARYT